MTWYLITNSEQITPELVVFCFGSLVVIGVINFVYIWLKQKVGKK